MSFRPPDPMFYLVDTVLTVLAQTGLPARVITSTSAQYHRELLSLNRFHNDSLRLVGCHLDL
jgi:hypothetical protein